MKWRLNILATEFSQWVLEKVIASPCVAGIIEFFSQSYSRYEMYISSGTPTAEIETILNRKDIRKYFRAVFGSPESKINHVRKIIEDSKYQSEKLVFVGDALSAREAARNTGIHFIGRFTTSEEIKNEKFLIKDFSNFRDILKKVNDE